MLTVTSCGEEVHHEEGAEASCGVAEEVAVVWEVHTTLAEEEAEAEVANGVCNI